MLEKFIGKMLSQGHISPQEAIDFLKEIQKQKSNEELEKKVKDLESELEGLKLKLSIYQTISDPLKDKLDPITPWVKPFTDPLKKPIQYPWDKKIGDLPYGPPYGPIFKDFDRTKPTTYGDLCSCNPKNGGSGICGCVMANEEITARKGTYSTGIATATYDGYLKVEFRPDEDTIEDQAGRV